MADYSAELDFARELATIAGEIALKHFRRDPEVRRKRDGTFVTEADSAVEAELRARISKSYPDHNILGEEEGLSTKAEGEPTWIIDPIDGTNNYIAGIPIWGTLVALRVDDRPVVGVCHAPVLRETYEAAHGLGARLNGETIWVDPITDLANALVVTGGLKAMVENGFGPLSEELARRSFRTRDYGDFWGHMLVARGAAHVMIEPELAVWDVAALQPIVEEAGGRITHLDGEPWTKQGSCLTTCGTLHDQIVELAQSFTATGAP